MRVAMLAPRATIRGPLPKTTRLLVDALRKRGCEVELLPWGRRQEREGLADKLVGRLQDVRSARQVVNGGAFPVVVVHTAHDWRTLGRDVILLRALKARARQVIVQFHGSQSQRLAAPGSILFKAATGRLLALSDGVLVLSREEQAELTAFSPEARVFTVRYPQTVPTMATIRDAEPEGRNAEAKILSVSRLMVAKGLLDLVRALPLVRREHPCRLVVAGAGPAESGIRTLAAELDVSDYVDFPGYVEGEELARLYGAADVFALPTYHPEGFPTVILEAMAAGLPIVTTRWRGPADHLVEGENALFVPAHDSVALASSLTRLVKDEQLRYRMGQANREKARVFDPDSVAEEYLAVLERIVEASRAADRSR
jgi:glycosyltransferase involved in cell wall biosynthesis